MHKNKKSKAKSNKKRSIPVTQDKLLLLNNPAAKELSPAWRQFYEKMASEWKEK